MNISRRDFTLSGLAAGAAFDGAALAKAPMATTQAAPVYRMKLGEFQITAIGDGHIDLETKLFPFAAQNQREVRRLLARAHMADPVRTSVNTYLVNTGAKLVLIDTGGAKAMGPTMGSLPQNLAVAGVKPEDVDAVLLTHMHPDHVSGLTTTDGKAFFPNAEVLVSQPDWAFWTDNATASRMPAEARPFFKMAQDAVKPYGDRVRRFTWPAEVSPGIHAMRAPGHTPGHTMYRVVSGKDQILIWGDIVHVQALQFANPIASIAYDSDQARAARTRQRVFDMVVRDGLRVAGMHLSFPGIGYVDRWPSGGFVYRQATWSPTV